MASVVDLHIETFTRDGVDILRDIRWEVKDGRALTAGPLNDVLTDGLLSELYDHPCKVGSSNGRYWLHGRWHWH